MEGQEGGKFFSGFLFNTGNLCYITDVKMKRGDGRGITMNPDEQFQRCASGRVPSCGKWCGAYTGPDGSSRWQ